MRRAGSADGDLAARALEAPTVVGVPGRDPAALARRGRTAGMRAVCGAVPHEIANIYDSGVRRGTMRVTGLLVPTRTSAARRSAPS